MKSTVARTCALFVLGCGIFLSTARAQVIERYAGTLSLVDVPGEDAPVVPVAVSVGSDGYVYVLDGRKNRLVRLDVTNGIARAMPGLGPMPPYDLVPPEYRFYNPTSLAVSPASGALHAATYSDTYKVNLATGELENLGGWSGSFGTQGHMAFDPNGRLYFPSPMDNSVRMREPWGGVQVFAGGQSEPGFWGDGGPARNASFAYPRGVATDSEGNLYIADSGNNRVRKVSAADGIITTVAGNGQWYPSEDGVPATATAVSSPYAVAVDETGNLYIYENGMGRVRRVSAVDGTITTVAGNGNLGYSGDGGPATEASIALAFGNIALDTDGNLYLAEDGSNRLRRVEAATGTIDTVLGNGTMSFCHESSPRLAACLGMPLGLATDAQGNLFISDTNNLRIRRVDAASGQLATIAGNSFDWTHTGDGGLAIDASFDAGTRQIAFDNAGNLYIAGGTANRVRRIDAATGIIRTVAGNGITGFDGDGGPATEARFSWIQDVEVDASGNLYISDFNNRRIRKVDAGSGIVTTIAGNGATGFAGDGGPASAATLWYPDSLNLDSEGNLLFVDGPRIRRIDAATGIISTIAGNGGNYPSGDGGHALAAGLGWSTQFVLDGADNLILASGGLRRIDATTGLITSVPLQWLEDPANFTLQNIGAIAVDAAGVVYLSDADNDLIYRVTGLPVATDDDTPPVISPIVNGVAGPGGWYSSDVQVSWSTSDPESEVTATSGCESASVTSDTSGVTFTCDATSAGGTASRSVTIHRDTVAPTLNFGDSGPPPDAEGWIRWPASVHFNTSDELSGVYSTSSGSPVQVAGEGAGLTAQVIVTDNAGNSATFTTPAFNIDSTPPSVGSSVCCNMSDSGWYNRDVIVDWTVEDLVSPIRSVEGCVDTTVVEDTGGITFTCTASSAGGTQTHSLTIRRDTTPPQLQFGASSPAPNSSGWHAGDVSIPFTTSDALSGVASTSSGNVVITGEGANLTTSVVVTDEAGNSATFTSPPVSIDRSAPLLQPVIAGTLGTNGWYTSDVQVSWAITAAPGSILSSSGCGASSITTDTAGVTFTCSVVSGGGSASQSVTIKRDATLPILTWRTPSPTPNAAGWIRANASFPFYAPTDALSGIASVSTPSPLVVSTEGVGVTGVVAVTDRAGNVAQFTSAPRNIDKTLPTIDLLTPADGAVYGFYSNVYADYGCADAGSGTASCSGNVADGVALNTRTLNGIYSFKVTAKDVAGNIATRVHAWSVTGALNFDGFLAPANNLPVFNLVNRGTRVPLRWRLPDGQGGYVTSTASYQSVSVTTIACPADAVTLGEVTTAPAGISFDAGNNTFAYNWSIGSSWSGCRSVIIRLRDGSLHELRFKVQ